MLDAGAAKHRRHTPLAISQCGASPSARHGVCDRMMAGHIWRWPIPGEDMHVAQPRERRDRCREACCGPPDRPRGILGRPFCLMMVAAPGGRPPARPPGGHHRSDGQPIKMERQPQRPTQSLAHEENIFKGHASDVRCIFIFSTEY